MKTRSTQTNRHSARLRARLRLTGLLLIALPAFACTKDPGDVTAILDPSNPAGLLAGITGGQDQDPAIIVFSTAASHDGALGGRSGADALCVGSKDRAGRSCANVHALLSFSGDTILSMPSTYSIPDLPLKSSNGTLIATHWADTLSGSTRLLASISAAGVTSGGYWTFSTSTGALDSSNTCTGGTTNLGLTSGEYGDYAAPGPNWLSFDNTPCSDSMKILCICY